MTDDRWPRVKALFEAALERPPDERTAFLAAATGDDAELRREIDSLLVADAADAGFLDRLPVAGEPIVSGSLACPVLASGVTVGPYEIVATLGAGAMGEVYRARDTKLNRDVALKVLPQLFALDADRLARFTREAQMLATLNHPNIGAIYGLDESTGTQALVLELVDGPTLGDRIAAGPMPVEDALAIARQIAEALEAAHEKGIIHRDLKPANIKIARSGLVKVLDFGLAKVWDGAPQSDLFASPRLTATGIGERAILGTPAYMSPEQARGQTLDRRTDIWSFGCVLYEMLTSARRSPATPSPTHSPRFSNTSRTKRRCRPTHRCRFADCCDAVWTKIARDDLIRRPGLASRSTTRTQRRPANHSPSRRRRPVGSSA